MAVLSSRNGKFYDVPDADLKKYELPAEKVKEVLAGMEGGPGGPGVEPYHGPAHVIIHVTGAGATVEPGQPGPRGPEAGGPGVEPYGYYGYGYYRPYYYYRPKYYWGY